MKKILLMFVVLIITINLAFASNNDPRLLPSFNIKLIEGKIMNARVVVEGGPIKNQFFNRGDPFNGPEPMGSVILSRGDSVRVLLRNLKPDSFYSLRYRSNCIDLGKKTNRHGNLKTVRMDGVFNYTNLYELVDVNMGGDVARLKSGVSEDFELFNFQCTASTGVKILQGAEPKNNVREMVPGKL